MLETYKNKDTSFYNTDKIKFSLFAENIVSCKLLFCHRLINKTTVGN